MSWLVVLPLALAAFALLAFAFRLERRWWTTLLAALVFGLAGYALQARPGLPSAPRAAPGADADPQWASVEARLEMISSRYRSRSDRLLIADALARRGQFVNASILLNGAVEENPSDGEAWLALGNTLVEHADGVLTPPAIHAYRRAAEVAPGSPAPGYFLGLALIRQGSILEGRELWAATLESAAEGEPRDRLEERLAGLDVLLSAALEGGPAPVPPSGAADSD